MAVGDDALAAGFAIVPNSEEEGKVKYGAREINRTRDYIAQLKNSVMSKFPSTWSVAAGGTGSNTKSGARTNLGIRSGTANPSGGDNGDIYFKIV